MAIYDTVKSNLSRQELQLIEAGQHYKIYSAKVKYLPENIEKKDFFKLCYGMLNKCDELNIYTVKRETYEVLYKFIVVNVDIDAKLVEVRCLSKIDFMTDPDNITIDTKTELTLTEVKKLIDKTLKNVTVKLDTLLENVAKYQSETDDQLEEIELKLEDLVNETEGDKSEGDKSEGNKSEGDKSEGNKSENAKAKTN